MAPIRSLHQLSSAVRARRVSLGLSQAALADRAGVSRSWVNEFEAGKATAEIRAVLAVLAALALDLDLSPHESSPDAEPADAHDEGPTVAAVDLGRHLDRYGAS